MFHKLGALFAGAVHHSLAISPSFPGLALAWPSFPGAAYPSLAYCSLARPSFDYTTTGTAPSHAHCGLYLSGKPKDDAWGSWNDVSLATAPRAAFSLCTTSLTSLAVPDV